MEGSVHGSPGGQSLLGGSIGDANFRILYRRSLRIDHRTRE